LSCQLTIIKLEGYGPWTLELGSDREHQLQMLQARIYADLQDCFSDKNGLVFFNRFDEFIAASNQISLRVHKEIHDKLTKKYNLIKISMTIAKAKTPAEADKKINEIRKNSKNMVFPNIYAEVEDFSSEPEDGDEDENEDNKVKIIHMDVDSSTSIAKEYSAYGITNLMLKIHGMLSDAFLKEDSLAFFLGGDNFMIIAKGTFQVDKLDEIIDDIKKTTGIRFNCGIGRGSNARTAVKYATKSLDQIREHRKNGKLLNVIESS
jgi:GTP cyclohydrolase IIa